MTWRGGLGGSGVGQGSGWLPLCTGTTKMGRRWGASAREDPLELVEDEVVRGCELAGEVDVEELANAAEELEVHRVLRRTLEELGTHSRAPLAERVEEGVAQVLEAVERRITCDGRSSLLGWSHDILRDEVVASRARTG